MKGWLVVAICLVSGGVGYLAGKADTPAGDGGAAAERQRELQVRTEEYQSSCASLAPGARLVADRLGEDVFLTVTGQERYHVVGINFAPERSPVFFWWGAGLANARQECAARQE